MCQLWRWHHAQVPQKWHSCTSDAVNISEAKSVNAKAAQLAKWAAVTKVSASPRQHWQLWHCHKRQSLNQRRASFIVATLIAPDYVSITAATLTTLKLPRVSELESKECQFHGSDTDNTGLCQCRGYDSNNADSPTNVQDRIRKVSVSYHWHW